MVIILYKQSLSKALWKQQYNITYKVIQVRLDILIMFRYSRFNTNSPTKSELKLSIPNNQHLNMDYGSKNESMTSQSFRYYSEAKEQKYSSMLKKYRPVNYY